MTRSIPSVPIQTEYFAFQGGLDLETPALQVRPGSLINCFNYEPSTNGGGYRRPAGYERFDGQPRPSDATYDLVACTLTSTPAVGDTLVIGGANVRFVRLVTGGMLVTGKTSAILPSTAIVAGVTTIGTTAANTAITTPLTGLEDAQNLVDCAAVYRDVIQAVPGSGPVRGVWVLNGVTYAFRNNVGNTAGAMFKSSTVGWTQVDLGEVVSFTNANASVVDGVTLTQGTVTATVRRVVLETGALGGTNSGKLYITDRAGGSFSAASATTSGGGTLTLDGTQTAVTLPAGGRYEFDNYAFGSKVNATRMYGANGVGPAFEFDGTTFVSLDTKGTPNTPSFVRAHRNYLYLAQGASMINSSVGNPYRYVAGEGSTEIGVGEVITGFASLPGEALGIFARNRSYSLTGASPTTWSLQVIRADVGAVAYTLQALSETLFLDDRGVVSISNTQQYGNFNDATLSRNIQRLINAYRPNAIASVINREKGHYKLFMNTGETLTMGYSNQRLLGFTNGQVGFLPSCACCLEDATGVERTFVGDSNGFVYEMNRGSTYDGADFESFIKIYYINSKSPEIRKRYRRMTLEMTADKYASLRFSAEFEYGNPEVETHMPGSSESIVATGPNGSTLWDASNWDEFIWDGQDVLRPSLSISGTGINIALSFYSKSKYDFGHTLSGAVVHYTPRRLQRT